MTQEMGIYDEDLFIFWELSKENPEKYLTQDEIVIEYIKPSLDNIIQFIRHFYITKINFTNVRFQVFLDKNTINKIDNIQNIFTNLKLINNPEPRLINIVENYGPLEMELNFREFLTDMTHINLDLHNNIAQAKIVAQQIRMNIQTDKKIRDFLENYLLESSFYFNELMKTNKKDLFWEWIQYRYESKTPWMHFYFNPILGFDFNYR